VSAVRLARARSPSRERIALYIVGFAHDPIRKPRALLRIMRSASAVHRAQQKDIPMKTIILALAATFALATAAEAQGYGYGGYGYGGYRDGRSGYSGYGYSDYGYRDYGYSPNQGFKRRITYPNYGYPGYRYGY